MDPDALPVSGALWHTLPCQYWLPSTSSYTRFAPAFLKAGAGFPQSKAYALDAQSWPGPPAPPAGVRLLRSGAPSCSLPDYIYLKKLLSRAVMPVYMALANWHRRLGPLDAVAATVADGRMVMPKPLLPRRHSRRPGPDPVGWERHNAAKKARGSKFASCTWQGVVV